MNSPLDDFSFSDPFKTWWPFVIALIVGLTTTIRGYFGGPKCPSQVTIPGRTAVITGGSTGIGLEVVCELFRRGGRMIIGTRDVDGTKERLRKRGLPVTDPRLVVRELDLSLLSSVRKFAESLGTTEAGREHPPEAFLIFIDSLFAAADEGTIDILINNAAVIFLPFRKTEEGFETHLVTNYLSHFLLTHLLLPKLRAAQGARIINVSAQAHYVSEIFLDDMNVEIDYTPNKAFGQSKLAMAIMARSMAKHLRGEEVTINAMHPGIVRDTRHMKNSPFDRSLLVKVATWPWVWLLMKTPQQGAQTIIYMAVAPELSKTSGKYFSNCSAAEPSQQVLDDDLGDKLYTKSLQLTGLSRELIH